jgi:WD40 repeat protein
LALWQITSGQPLVYFKVETQFLNSIACSPNGLFIATIINTLALTLWDTQTGQELVTLTGERSLPYTLLEPVFSADGAILAVRAQDGVRLWDLAAGIELIPLSVANGVRACAFSPDGQSFAAASRAHTIWLWPGSLQSNPIALAGHTDSVWGCAFSPDGKYLASVSTDHTLKIWDVATAAQICEFMAGNYYFGDIVWLPDGRTLMTNGLYSGDSGVKRFQLEVENLVVGPPIVTAWRRLKSNAEADGYTQAFTCPCCRAWVEVADAALGTEQSCQKCGVRVNLNRFVVNEEELVLKWRSRHLERLSWINPIH